MKSLENVTESVRQILGSMLPSILEASLEADVFSLGLDSLNVFKAIKIIKAAMGLSDQLAPRHLYANPTLGSFSAYLFQKVSEPKQTQPGSIEESLSTHMKRQLDQHKARQSFRLNAFDYVVST